MEQFNRLVSEQMQTMEKLLFLQAELERCQEVEQQLSELQEEDQLNHIQNEIVRMKQELKEIQQTFQRQTEEVIQSYQSEHQLINQ